MEKWQELRETVLATDSSEIFLADMLLSLKKQIFNPNVTLTI
jgi:hypothetical protein